MEGGRDGLTEGGWTDGWRVGGQREGWESLIHHRAEG